MTQSSPRSLAIIAGDPPENMLCLMQGFATDGLVLALRPQYEPQKSYVLMASPDDVDARLFNDAPQLLITNSLERSDASAAAALIQRWRAVNPQLVAILLSAERSSSPDCFDAAFLKTDDPAVWKASIHLAIADFLFGSLRRNKRGYRNQ